MLFNAGQFIIRYQAIQNMMLKRYKNRSLQAQASTWKQMRKRASDFSSCLNREGSATVEATLALPIFLCAMSMILMMGQSIVTEVKIQHAVTKTAQICAGQKALNRKPDVFQAFYSVFQMSSGDSSCIAGKKAGIHLNLKEKKDGEQIEIQANYRLRIIGCFLGELSCYKTVTATQRVFCGYSAHGSELEGGGESIVYVAKTGDVYHTSLSCSHICITISGDAVEQFMKHSNLDACEKCIKKREKLSRLYITEYGECFHSSLHCSGLKRSVRAVKLSEVGNMKMCSRCAARGTAGN